MDYSSTLPVLERPQLSTSRARYIQEKRNNNNLMSSSTLQHGTIEYSFGKSDRFRELLHNPDVPNNYDVPDSKTKRATSLGYGNKVNLSQVIMKTRIDNPGPAHYKLKSDFEPSKAKGRTFGLPYSSYSKVCLPGQIGPPLEDAKEMPGPGQYKDIFKKVTKQAITIKPRAKMFNDMPPSDAPSANHYTVRDNFATPQRFRKIGFGYGKKYDFTLTSSSGQPGPGQYTLKSAFDKYGHNNLVNKKVIAKRRALEHERLMKEMASALK